jgi:hypothetical protein
MRWLRYVLVGGVLVAVGCALGRARRTDRAWNVPAGERNASVEAAMEDQAMARAVSEVNSGEYDMQG